MDLIPSSSAYYALENYLIQISKGSRIIYWIVVVLIIGILTLLPFIYVDVSVHAPGFFQSEIEKQRIYAPFPGKILSSSVKTGHKVNKGDTLLIIDSESLKARINAIENQIMENKSAMTDLEKLNLLEQTEIQLKSSEFRTQRYFTEYSNMLKSYNIQNQKYQKLKADNERSEILHRQHLIPDSEFENTVYTFRLEEENLNKILIYQKTLWHADLMQRRKELFALQADFKSCKEELENRVILAPIAGEIIQSPDIQRGSIVGSDQFIAEISPDGDLIATCLIKPSNIGLVKKDQIVRIQVDALNYNEWGMLNAKILEISDDMITEGGSTAFFRVRCKPEQTFLSLKNGVKADLKKGMSVNARIIVTRRSLFNLLFDKADKWLNPYLKRQN